MSGKLYLLHWEPALEGGQRPMHYLGWTNRDVDARVLDHLNNGPHAAKIVTAAVEAGREIKLAKVWSGNRSDESKLKRSKHGFRHICPVCLSGGLLSGSNDDEPENQGYLEEIASAL